MLSRNDGFARRIGLASPLEPEPPVLEERDDRYVVQLEAPGVSERDIEVSIDRGMLAVRAARGAALPDGWTAVHRERATGTLACVFAVPTNADVDRATATLANGVLELAIPKMPQAQPRRLTVNSDRTN